MAVVSLKVVMFLNGHKDTGDTIRIPASSFILFHWSKGGRNVTQYVAMRQQRQECKVVNMDPNDAGLKLKKNWLWKCFTSKEIHSTRLWELKDTRAVFWWVTLNVNFCFFYKTTPQGTFHFDLFAKRPNQTFNWLFEERALIEEQDILKCIILPLHTL